MDSRQDFLPMDEASKRELDRWRYALDNAEDGIWDWSSDSATVFRSARCLTMLGYTPGSIGETVEDWRELVHPDDRERQAEAIRQHIAGASTYKVEYRLRCADGSWRWILDRGKIIRRGSDGQALRVVGTHTDISAYKDMEQRLLERETLLDEAQRIGRVGSWSLDVASGKVWWSAELYRISGWPFGQDPPDFDQQQSLFTPDSLARVQAAVAGSIASGQGYEIEIEMLRPDGERRIVEVACEVVRDGSGEVARLIGAVRDVTEQRQATESARWRNKLLNRIASVGRIGGFDLDMQTGAVQWTEENYRIHGLPPGTPLQMDQILERYDEPSRERSLAALRRLESGESREETIEAVYDAPDGRRLVLQLMANVDGAPGGRRRLTGLTRDITEEREAGERIEQLAHYDVLTGLPNRFLFHQRAEEAIRLARRTRSSLGLLFIDLDRFKYVNDNLGHAAGDALLQEVSGRLKACLRGSDLIGRQGGDEFMVMLCELRKPEDAALVAEKIIAAVRAPFSIGEGEVQVGCSVGIALLNDANADLESLMRASDTAMYAAKDAGRNTYQFYNDSFFERMRRRGQLETELRQAITKEELFLVYQPTVSLSGGGDVVGFEALLRWRAPDGELRSPMEFIPIAEETGEILSIGLWVLEQACRQARAWDDAGLVFSSMAVNVSAVQLRDPQFAQRVLDICARTQWPPWRLVLELTESALMHDSESLRRTFAVFEANRVQLSVDDFGTGFSNLLYLHRFPVRQLKIDRSFISQMLEDLQVGVLTQAIISLGHAMGLRVVAEGVETEITLRALRNQGCDEAQGFLLTHPLPPKEMEAWVRARAG